MVPISPWRVQTNWHARWDSKVVNPTKTCAVCSPNNPHHRQDHLIKGTMVQKHSQENESMVETDLSAEFWRTARQKADHKRPNRQTNSTSKPMPKRPNHSGGVTRQQRYTDCCDYCRESNNCRNGRRIECNECHRIGHKSKFCSYYWDAGQEEWPTSTLRPNHDINYSDLDSCDSSNKLLGANDVSNISLSMAHINICSLRRKIDQIRHIVTKHDYDIFGVSEHG